MQASEHDLGHRNIPVAGRRWNIASCDPTAARHRRLAWPATIERELCRCCFFARLKLVLKRVNNDIRYFKQKSTVSFRLTPVAASEN